MSNELKACLVEGCNKPLKKHDSTYCSMHRARINRTGRLELESPEKRIKRSIMYDLDTECWEWSKYLNEHGYGRMRFQGKKELSHRVSYRVFVGEIPEGMMVLHTCDNRCCVNPAHLFLGTAKDNYEDAFTKGRVDPVTRAKERWIKCPTFRKQS